MLQDPTDPGYWAVTRRADIVAVSRNSEGSCPAKECFREFPRRAAGSMTVLPGDGPATTHLLRKLVHAAFTPRQIRRIEDSI